MERKRPKAILTERVRNEKNSIGIHGKNRKWDFMKGCFVEVDIFNKPSYDPGTNNDYDF